MELFKFFSINMWFTENGEGMNKQYFRFVKIG